MIKKVSTDKAPAAIGPYSQAIIADKFLFASGQIPINPATGNVEATTIEEQATQVCKNIGAILIEAGCGYENVVKTTTDVSFSGAKLIQDYWVLVRTYDPDIKNTYSDAYQIYVLYTMPKAMLDKQLNNEIDKAMDDGEMSESQKEAFKNVKKVLAESGL